MPAASYALLSPALHLPAAMGLASPYQDATRDYLLPQMWEAPTSYCPSAQILTHLPQPPAAAGGSMPALHAWALESKLVARQALAEQHAWAERMRQHYCTDEKPEKPSQIAEDESSSKSTTTSASQANGTTDPGQEGTAGEQPAGAGAGSNTFGRLIKMLAASDKQLQSKAKATSPRSLKAETPHKEHWRRNGDKPALPSWQQGQENTPPKGGYVPVGARRPRAGADAGASSGKPIGQGPQARTQLLF